MIAAAHQQLRHWIASLAGEVPISLLPPGQSEKTGAGIGLYLMDIGRPAVSHQGHNQRLQLTLRYLVTAWAEPIEDGHELLEKLLLGAAENSDVQIEAESPPLALWTALGAVPRPAFFLRLTVQRERLERPAPLVKAPPIVVSAPINRLAAEKN